MNVYISLHILFYFPESRFLLTEAFSPFIFNVPTDTFWFKSTILLCAICFNYSIFIFLFFLAFFCLFFKIYFIYFGLRWVFVAARGLSLVAVSGS